MENINVAVRMRPLNGKEIQRNDLEMWKVQKGRTIYANETVICDQKKKENASRIKFTFDHCFDWKVSNKQVYEQCSKNVALSSLQGINGTIFMYGQTGAGKTYSMIGQHNYNEEPL